MGGGAVGRHVCGGLGVGEEGVSQLDHQIVGCERAVVLGLDAERVITAWSVDHLLAWAWAWAWGPAAGWLRGWGC